MAGVEQHHLQAARLKDLVDGNPVHSRRFHGNRLHSALHQPVRQPVGIGGEGPKRTYWLSIPIGRHCDIVILGAAVDPRRIGLDALEQRSTASTPVAGCALVPHCLRPLLALHLRLFHNWIWRLASANRGRRESDILSNGITTSVSPLTLSLQPTDHAPKRALHRTIARPVSVRGRRSPPLLYACSPRFSSGRLATPFA